MSTAVTHSPANQDRPLLRHPPRRSSDQRRIRTLLDLLTIEKMDGVDRTMRQGGGSNNNISRWKTLRERLGLKAINCCGIATWRYDNSSPLEDDENNNNNNSSSSNNNNNNVNVENVVLQEVEEAVTRQQGEEVVGPTMMNMNMNMNLAAALAAERQYRAAESTGGYSVDEGINGGDATPSRVSLMRLLEETSDGCELEREKPSDGGGCGGGGGGGGGGMGSDTVCCVCMGREKGAAFIPCGHTYCRVCSRELWLNRGSCPLCNRRILEILDIF